MLVLFLFENNILSNVGSIHIENTGIYVKQNFNIGGNVYIDYITNTFGSGFGISVAGSVGSNIGKFNDLTILGNLNNKGNISLKKLINYGDIVVSNSVYIVGNLRIDGKIYGNSIVSKEIYSNNIMM